MIAYRTPTAADAESLATLARETFGEAFGHLYQADDLAAFYAEWKTPDAFTGWIADPRVGVLIAEDAGHPVGYAMIGLDQKLDYDPGSRYAVELKQLYIRASHHGQGVAQHLMDWVIGEAEAAGADEIVLSVYSENARGMAFYQKYGFAYHADTTFVVGKQIDAEYLYVKRL
jgi:diamine N-acetyltransferase